MIDHVNQQIELDVNQGVRPAYVLAILEDQALVEYVMPNGTTALRVIDRVKYWTVRRFGYTSTPTRWLEAMIAAGVEWFGTPQQNGFKLSAPSVEALYAERQARRPIGAKE